MQNGHLFAADIEPVKFTELVGGMLMETDRFGVYNWVYFILIYMFLIFIYNKVFRTRRLPIIKNAIVYLLIAIGAFMLLIFQIDAGLPIVYSLGVAIFMMLLVRIRYFIEGRRKRKQSE